MSQLGIGVMINMLGGNKDSVEAYKSGEGKVIKSLKIESDNLEMRFEDGTGIAFSDEGQSCCEHRHMSCDDDLNYHVGATFMKAELESGPDVENDGDCHEQEFLKITTSNGMFTVVNHNEHNGYYGGFSVRVKKLNN